MRDALKQVPLLAGLPDGELERLAARSRRVSLPDGEVLFDEGSEGDEAYVVETGELEILKRSRGREIRVATSGPGAVIGEMAILQATPRTATVRAVADSNLVEIDGAAFRRLIEESQTAARSLLETMFARWRETESALRESEKMAQLGSLSAGVAHELNNPAAAIGRAAAQLSEMLAADTPDDDPFAGRVGTRRVLSSLARSDAEEEMEDALDSLGIEEAWTYTPVLVDLEVDPDEVASIIPPGGGAAWLGTLARRHEEALLAGEIQDASQRISEIVGSLRSYTYLDRGERQSVDVNRGLVDTLVMLRSKLRGISVETDYADELPALEGQGGELNQVWTNLLANAADALGGSGMIQIRTHADGPWVVVEIEDDGPGIPPDVRERIFDPFFTTKPIGEGTGLGLDISRRIVQEQHGGDLTCESEPGCTVFRVRLPVE